jgi:hypothetical protein
MRETHARRLPMLVLALAAAAAFPDTAAAQSCLGMPLEAGTYIVAGEVMPSGNVMLYRGRAGRELGERASVLVEVAHAAFDPEPAPAPAEWGSGNQAGATLVYRLEALALPFCSFASLRGSRAHREYEWPYYGEGRPPLGERSNSALAGFVGIAAGAEGRLGERWTAVPFASAALGWLQTRMSGGCVQNCSTAGPSSYTEPGEAQLQLETEAGVMLRHQRFFGGAGLHWVFGEGDPLIQPSVFRVEEGRRLILLRIGVVF